MPFVAISFPAGSAEGVPVVVEDGDKRYGMGPGGGKLELVVRSQERCSNAEATRHLLLVYLAKANHLERNTLGGRLGVKTSPFRGPVMLVALTECLRTGAETYVHVKSADIAKAAAILRTNQ